MTMIGLRLEKIKWDIIVEHHPAWRTLMPQVLSHFLVLVLDLSMPKTRTVATVPINGDVADWLDPYREGFISIS